MVSTLLSRVLPEENLSTATFEEIIRFREETAGLRKHFVADLEARIGQLRSVPTPREWAVACQQILFGIETDLRKYQAEFEAGRMKIWPAILRSSTGTVAVGSTAAVGLSLIPRPKIGFDASNVEAIARSLAVAPLEFAS